MEPTRRILLAATLFLLCQVVAVRGQCSGSSTTQTLTASTGTIEELKSKNYPSYYPHNHNCVSTISAPSGYSVLFYVDYESIERSYDFLEIKSGSTRLYYSEYNDPVFVGVSFGTQLTVSFTTDYSIAYGGFHMYYIAIDTTVSCGDTVTASSSPGQLFYAPSLSGSSCTYRIQASTPASTLKITVLFVVGTVYIIEGGNTVTYSTTGSTYGSTSNIVSVRGTSSSGFVVEYEEVSSRYTGNMVTSSPDTSICASTTRTATAVANELTSPNYPGSYPNDVYCGVRIDANDVSKSVSVFLHDAVMNSGDTLVVYDGTDTSFNSLTLSNANETFISSSYSLYLAFYTNSYSQNRGFRLQYQTVDRVTPVCFTYYANTTNVTASETAAYILSPNHPSSYVNNLDVYWLIVKPNATLNIVLDFTVFEVEEATDCYYDYVSIYDGACTTDPLMAKLCGYSPATFEDTSGLYILIHFHTDSSVTYKGWSLTYYIGSYVDPSASTEEDSGLPDYVYPIIAIGIIIVISIIIFVFVVFKGRGRVTHGSVVAAPPIKKRTTHDLLQELTARYGSADTDKQPKVKRKGTGYHPQPSAPGPGVNVIFRGQTPHPPPGLPSKQPFSNIGMRGTDDPAYPPDFLGGGLEKQGQIAPVLTEQSDLQPVPLPDVSAPSKIPPPFRYITPAEARNAGIYG